MLKIVYANLFWFFIVVVSMVTGAIERSDSEFWENMPDVRVFYDLFYVGAFGLVFIIASVGVLKQKKWGYKIVMAFNMFLTLLAFLPVVALVIHALKSGIPLLMLKEVGWGFNIDNIAISSISFVFIILMWRANARTVFENK